MAYTITLVDEINNKTIKTTPGQKLFYFENVKTQMKRGYYEDSSNQKRIIYQYDIVPPTLTVDNPKGVSSSNPTFCNSSSYTVSGTVKDTESGVASVTVNGKTAIINGNKYSCTLVNLSATNVTTVTVVAKDVAGNATTVTRFLRYDNTKPIINVNEPCMYDNSSGSYITFSDSVSITGTVKDNESGIQSITVHGGNASLSGTYFSYNVNLTSGNKTAIKIIAKDKAGNISESVVYVTRMPLKISNTIDHSNQSRNYYVNLYGMEITSIEIRTRVKMVLHSSWLDGQSVTREVWHTNSITWNGSVHANQFLLDAACSYNGSRPDKYTFFEVFKINGYDVTW